MKALRPPPRRRTPERDEARIAAEQARIDKMGGWDGPDEAAPRVPINPTRIEAADQPFVPQERFDPRRQA